MPKVTQNRAPRKRPAKPRQRRQSPPPEPVIEPREVRVSSVIFGLTLIAATIVTGAAWMGGSLSRIEERMAHVMDSTARSMGFAIEHIVIEGVSKEIDDELRNAILIEPGENMFRADPKTLQQRAEATQLVMNVRVNRFWPNRVIIVASPRKPIALLRFDDSYAAIDRLGGAARIQLPDEDETLLKISGDGAPQAVGSLLEMLEDYPGLQARIVTAHRVEDRRWDIDLVSGHTLRFPDDVRLPAALVRLDETQRELSLLDRLPAVIDMRSESRMFIKLQTPLTAALRASVEDG